MNDKPETPVSIAPAERRGDVEIAKSLFLEYAASLGFDLGFQGFDDELSGLPGGYAPPRGRLLLAWVGGRTAGCVALREIDADTCEMKRLYVRPTFRGKGVGRALAQRVIDEARSIGYRRMRLDAIENMREAVALYRSLGFVEIAPYRFNPFEGALFLEVSLTGGQA
jgi:GNAT superfamily N-acetyltransferase